MPIDAPDPDRTFEQSGEQIAAVLSGDIEDEEARSSAKPLPSGRTPERDPETFTAMPAKTGAGGANQTSRPDGETPERPPLVGELKVIDRVAFHADSKALAAPQIARLLVSTALKSRERGAACVILPSTNRCAASTAVLAAIECLASDLPASIKLFLTKGLSPGGRVRLLPRGPVYSVGETCVMHGSRGIFLYCTNAAGRAASAKRFVTEDKIALFEPTFRKRPVADGTERLIAPPPNDLEVLTGSRFYGNASLFRTRVFVAGARTEFERALHDLRLTPAGGRAPAGGSLAASLAWGALDDKGVPSVLEPSGSLGNPLVCIGKDLQELAGSMLDPKVEPNSLVLLTDRLDLVLKDLDLAGRIAERQRLLLLVDARRRRDLAPLRRQGWIIWEPTADDILGNANQECVVTGCAGLDLTQQAAAAEAQRNPGYIECGSGPAPVDAALARLSTLLRDETAEHDEQLQGLLDDAQRGFFLATGRLTGRTESDWGDIASLTQRFRTSSDYVRKHLGEESVRTLMDYADALDAFVLGCQGEGLTPKGRELLKLAERAAAQTGFRQLFVAGNRRSAEEANALFASHGLNISCAQISKLLDERDVRSLVAFSVMRRDAFERLTDPWPCSSFLFLGYDFELACYRRRLWRRDINRKEAQISTDARTKLTGIPASVPSTREATDALSGPVNGLSLDAFDRVARDWSWSRKIVLPRAAPDEPMVDAFLVRFVGHTWAAMTADHRSISLQQATSGKTEVRYITLADLSVGTRIVFREGADADVIKAIAEDRVGQDRYAALRRRAGIWRDVLRAARVDAAEAMRRLAKAGVHRNIATVRAWLSSASLIGPRSEDDLEAIREAFPGSRHSEAEWKACRDAIAELRSLHISAGNTLTELLAEKCGGMLFEPSDAETTVDLGIGRIWIVEVAAVESASRSCPSHAANRLQWTQGGWKATHLAEELAQGLSEWLL